MYPNPLSNAARAKAKDAKKSEKDKPADRKELVVTERFDLHGLFDFALIRSQHNTLDVMQEELHVAGGAC